MQKSIVIGVIALLFLALAVGLSIAHYRDESNWERGEYVTLRRAHYHEGCGGEWRYSGQSEVAPFSERDRFNLHTCSRCGETNKVLNAIWPEHRREWRSACVPLSRVF